MQAYRMTAVNSESVKRVRYCFARSWVEAQEKFKKEYWYLTIQRVVECAPSEASIVGCLDYSVG